MKKHIQMLVVAFTAVFFTACGINNQTATINGGGGSGGRRVVTPASPTKVSDSIFGNQPIRPTADVVRESWGGTMNTSHWANDNRRGSALIQAVSPNEPVLISRATGFVWRYGCENRVVPVEPPTEEVVENVGSGGGNSIVQNGSSYAFEFNMPITIINSDDGGGYYPQPRQYRPQPRYCPPPQRRYCPPRPICPPGMRPVRRYR